MSAIVILVIVLVVIVAAVAAALVMGVGGRGRQNNGRALRRRFGPEYDRVAAQHGDSKAAEQELTARVRDREALTLRPLAQDERERFSMTWVHVQERFVDDPLGAAQQADQVIGGLLTALGYPSEDRDRQLALASVDHGRALGDYRQAHELAQRGSTKTEAAEAAEGDADTKGARDRDGAVSGTSSTEQLRQAVLHYRVLFRELLDSSSTERARVGS